MRRFHYLSLGAVLACASLAGAQDYEGGSRQTNAPTTVPTSTPTRAASDYTVIYSNVSGLPSALVPGMGGLEFKVGTSSGSAFDRPYNSPNGNWIFRAFMETGATTDDEVIVVNDAVVVREGDPAPYEAGQNHGPIDTKVDVNDTGEFVFATTVDPSSTNDDYIVRGDGASAFTVIAREGDPIASLPGNTYDDILVSPVILGDGSVGFSADGVDGTVTATTDDLLILGPTLLAQEGVTIPPGQVAAEFWENYDLNDFFATEDGLHWLCQGDLTGATTDDDVLVYDGTVVIQENVILPGTDANPVDGSGIVGCNLDQGGNWYARGNNDTSELDWVVRNGVVIAKGGDPIFTGATELWDDTTYSFLFFMHAGNSVGDYVVAGVTDAVDTAANAVIVLNGTEVLARENDPVDLDGNGSFDDDAFISIFGNDDAILFDDGTLRFVCSLKDSLGTSFGNVILEVSASEVGTPYCFGDGSGTACPCGNNNDGSVPGSGCANGIFASGAQLTGSGAASLSADTLVLATTGLEPSNSGLYFQANNDLSPGNVWGDGLQCAGGQLVRLGVRFSDAAGYSDTSGYPQSISVKAGNILAGDTKYYQCWYRNPTTSPCGSDFNASNGYSITWTP